MTMRKYRLTYTSPTADGDITKLVVEFTPCTSYLGWVRAFARQVGLPLLSADRTELSSATTVEEVTE